jgi:hypothetical protein
MLNRQATASTVSLRTSKRARAQIVMLLAQFLLGMGVNLIGLPSETSGVALGVTVAALVGHVAIALGLTVGAILTVRLAASMPGHRALAWSGLLLVVVTIAAGVPTMLLDSNWWSYLMAVGFAALLVVYGRLYLLVVRDGARRAG